jgi:hypothetical protein
MRSYLPLAPIIVLSILLASCGRAGPRPDDTDTAVPPPLETSIPSLTPFQPEGYVPPQPSSTLPVPTATDIGTAAPAENPLTIWISPAVPAPLVQDALASGLTPAVDQDRADVRLEVTPSPAAGTATWIYALVVPFPTIIDELPSSAIKAAWSGQGNGPFAGHPLWMTASTRAAFSAIWGEPALGAVSVAEDGSLVDTVWAEKTSWAIVPFEDLEPRWKVLAVDGQSPVRNDFDPDAYPLKVNFVLKPAPFSLVPTNRDPSKLTVLAMTGVTALVRGTATQMVRYGVLYPGEEVRQVLRSADLTHVSNEIPFYSDCPTPDPWTSSLIFCSDPGYIALLEDVGVDIVELTGNHEMDYGAAALLTTLNMYDQRGWLYYAGGRDLAEAEKAAKVTNNGNKLAFLGCNPVGPASDWATVSRPGSAPCDYPEMEADVAQLRAEGYLPIVTMQYNEYYQPEPTDYERSDFRAFADAGAVIVSGSQAHVPAAMELYGTSFIHYGLGNLFFDQMSYELPNGTIIYDTRDLFIDRHVFYDGRYLGTELLTYIIENYARPRLMTPAERKVLLQRIFSAAGW